MTFSTNFNKFKRNFGTSKLTTSFVSLSYPHFFNVKLRNMSLLKMFVIVLVAAAIGSYLQAKFIPA